MATNKTVTINGRLYDAVTGLPVESAPKAASTPATKPLAPATVKRRAAEVAAKSVHAAEPQKSKTLYRRATKKPVAPRTAISKRPTGPRHMDIARSSNVTKFAPHPVAAAVKKENEAITKAAATPDIAPKAHPVAARAHARVQKTQKVAAQKPVHKPAKQIKDEAIKAAVAAPEKKHEKQKSSFHWSNRFTIITAIFVVLIIGAYITWVNLPTISVGFAASRAGIAATYPQFKPDGYSLKQPVTYSDGTVTLTFKSNSGSSQYTVTQTRSSWDSSAVLNNVVQKAAGDNYVTTQESGLTIYSYNDDATWVNGGILYTIHSSAPLSGDQIRRIATSL